MWDNCKAPCLSLSALWAEWASLIPPQVRQPLLCQAAPLLPSSCTIPTSKPCQYLQVVSSRQSLTGNPVLEFQNASPKGHTGTELPLPPAATPSVLWHRKLCHRWPGNCKGLLHFPFTFYDRFIPEIYSAQPKAWNKNKASLQMWKITFYCDLCSR